MAQQSRLSRLFQTVRGLKKLVRLFVSVTLLISLIASTTLGPEVLFAQEPPDTTRVGQEEVRPGFWQRFKNFMGNLVGGAPAEPTAPIEAGLKPGDYVCTETQSVSEPPFWISSNDSGMQNALREYENFWLSTQKNGSVDRSRAKMILRNSIVRIRKDIDLSESGSNLYVPVEVISTRNTKVVETLRDSDLSEAFHPTHEVAQGRQGDQPGDTGYLWAGMLERTQASGDKTSAENLRARRDSSFRDPGYREGAEDNLVYKLKEDSVLIDFPQLDGLVNPTFKLKQAEDGTYQANECCFIDRTENKKCVWDYVFTAMSDNTDPIDFNVGPKCDSFYASLMAIDESTLGALMGVRRAFKEYGAQAEPINPADIENYTLLGFLRIPTGDPYRPTALLETSAQYTRTIFGALHPTGSFSNADRAARENNTDTWMHEKAWCGFSRAQIAYTTNEGLKVYPMQHQNAYSESGQHRSHRDGYCVDVRLQFETDEDINEPIIGPMNYQNDNRYSQQKTKNMIKLFIENGATDIIFDDPQLNGKWSYRPVNRPETQVNESAQHRDHIHVCFDPNKESIMQRSPQANEGIYDHSRVAQEVEGGNQTLRDLCR